MTRKPNSPSPSLSTSSGAGEVHANCSTLKPLRCWLSARCKRSPSVTANVASQGGAKKVKEELQRRQESQGGFLRRGQENQGRQLRCRKEDGRRQLRRQQEVVIVRPGTHGRSPKSGAST